MAITANKRKIEILWQWPICVAVFTEFSSNIVHWTLKNLCDYKRYKREVCVATLWVFLAHRQHLLQNSVIFFVYFSRISGKQWNTVCVTWWPTIENNTEQFWKECGTLFLNNFCELWHVSDQASFESVIVFHTSLRNHTVANWKWLKCHYDEVKPSKNLGCFFRLH